MSGLQVFVDPTSGSSGVRLLREDFRRIPAQLRPEIRRRTAAVGAKALRAAQQNASWSSRIPAALSLRTSFGGRNPGVEIVASQKKAPHARVYEGIVQSTFRHPVFGDRDWWVAQRARPYLLPAARGAGAELALEVGRAVDEVLTARGFGR